MNDTLQMINEERKLYGLTVKKIAKITELSEPYISLILNDKKPLPLKNPKFQKFLDTIGFDYEFIRIISETEPLLETHYLWDLKLSIYSIIKNKQTCTTNPEDLVKSLVHCLCTENHQSSNNLEILLGYFNEERSPSLSKNKKKNINSLYWDYITSYPKALKSLEFLIKTGLNSIKYDEGKIFLDFLGVKYEYKSKDEKSYDFIRESYLNDELFKSIVDMTYKMAKK